MAALLGILVSEKDVRQVPKCALSRDEVIFALSSQQLFTRLVEIGALVPVEIGSRKQAYDAQEVAEVWERVKRGEFKEQLSI